MGSPAVVEGIVEDTTATNPGLLLENLSLVDYFIFVYSAELVAHCAQEPHHFCGWPLEVE